VVERSHRNRRGRRAGRHRGWYVATGHLIYATDNAPSMRCPSIRKADRARSPVPLLDQVQAGFGNGAGWRSPAAGHLIFVPGRGQQGVQVVEVIGMAGRPW